MPKPDQKVSISAALQRPQRQKALPKPLPKDEAKDLAENIETDLQPIAQEVPEVIEKLEVSSELSELPKIDLLESKEETITQSEIPKSKPLIKIQQKVKVETNDTQALEIEKVKSETVPDKSKPILKPKLKPLAQPETLEVTEDRTSNQNDLQHDIPLESSANLILESSELIDLQVDPQAEPLKAVELISEVENVSNQEGSSQESVLENEAFAEILESDPSREELQDSEQGRSPEIAQPIFWCQAVGLVAGKYLPSPEAFHKGELLSTKNNLTYKAYVLSKAVKSLEKKTDLSVPHQFIVYPKTSKLHGVRFEILATDIASKIEEFENGQFNIRGLVTKQLDNSVLIEIQRRPEYLHPAQYDRFSLEVRGTLPIELIQQLVYIRCELIENYLSLVSYEHLACPYTPLSNSLATSLTTSNLIKTEKPILKPKAQKIDPELDSPSEDE